MANQGACTLSVLLLSIAAAAWVTAVPTAQAGTDALRRNLYGAESPEFFGFLDEHDSTEERSQDGLDDGGARRFDSSWRAGQPRREIDFAFGPTAFLVDDAAEPSLIGQGGLLPRDRMLLERFGKRNIDEIDRTAFDNFFKRNLGEMDRVGWSGFAKRLADYLTTGRTNALERHG